MNNEIKQHQPKTGQRCHCKPGQQRDNCPTCEGTGMVINFAAIRARPLKSESAPAPAGEYSPLDVICQERRDEAGESYYVVLDGDGNEFCRGRSMTSMRWIANSFSLVEELREKNDDLLAERDRLRDCLKRTLSARPRLANQQAPRLDRYPNQEPPK